MKMHLVLSSLLVGSLASAQVKTNQSRPFHLVIHSGNRQINGMAFTACHTGAGIESLCIFRGSGSEFHFQSSASLEPPLKDYEPLGLLVWNLPIDPNPYSEAMTLSFEPSSNVALPLFQPSSSPLYVTFDKQDHLSIISYTDDRSSPPVTGKVRALKNWYLCRTYYSSYTYRTLTWVFGDGMAKPQNPSCIKIDVRRRYLGAVMGS
ncbi:hypothetical protein GQ602_002093 [Ophiocordyceps camponoti-floridani]|uniref:DUF7907 domain-containing protein n=1 Tax=Ophiocordyceps camponoti-floridani TaxID=2030778 RepID=A0A8H4VFB0_9HYPO|nr:hypothetical protein GQ602_002093 [Ophiocordyceps camponoti-floridani]